VSDIEQLLLRTLGEHVELSTCLADDLCTVLADPGQIEQILVNLAVNARDAMPGGGKLTIHTAGTDVDEVYAANRVGLRPGRYASLKISDTGTGMPKAIADRAFEPFFSTKPKGQGTGMGLATVYGIVNQAGGHVRIYSEPGIGTTFTILLPATCQPLEQTSSQQPQGLQAGAGETVLVVEDEDALREVTRRILDRNGYRVLTAVSGPEAIEIATQHCGGIDILLTDVVMPHIRGPWSLCSRNLTRAPRGERPERAPRARQRTGGSRRRWACTGSWRAGGYRERAAGAGQRRPRAGPVRQVRAAARGKPGHRGGRR
jgi:two-component system, cell cycle sensor histidine kinase and response regulator CckA